MLTCAIESVVQASIVIITTAAGKLQDDTASDSLDPAVTLWLVYAFLSVAVSGILLILSGTSVLPAGRLSQVQPRLLDKEVERLLRKKGFQVSGPIDITRKRSGSSHPFRAARVCAGSS